MYYLRYYADYFILCLTPFIREGAPCESCKADSLAYIKVQYSTVVQSEIGMILVLYNCMIV